MQYTLCANKWCTCPSGQGAFSSSLITPHPRTDVYAACLAHTHNNAHTKSPRTRKEKRGKRRGKEEGDIKGKGWGEGGLEEEERGTSTLCVKSQPFTHGSSFYSLSDTRRWMVSSSLQTCGNRWSERLRVCCRSKGQETSRLQRGGSFLPQAEVNQRERIRCTRTRGC